MISNHRYADCYKLKKILLWLYFAHNVVIKEGTYRVESF